MKEMEIIVLKGKSNTGKSETLNIVYQLMLLFGYSQVPGHFRVLGNSQNHDCIDILKKNGVRVGIFTMGDYGDYEEYPKEVILGDIVQDLIKYLESNGCAKAVIACNTELIEALEFIGNYTPHIHIVDKQKTPDESLMRIINEKDAEILYKLI